MHEHKLVRYSKKKEENQLYRTIQQSPKHREEHQAGHRKHELMWNNRILWQIHIHPCSTISPFSTPNLPFMARNFLSQHVLTFHDKNICLSRHISASPVVIFTFNNKFVSTAQICLVWHIFSFHGLPCPRWQLSALRGTFSPSNGA